VAGQGLTSLSSPPPGDGIRGERRHEQYFKGGLPAMGDTQSIDESGMPCTPPVKGPEPGPREIDYEQAAAELEWPEL